MAHESAYSITSPLRLTLSIRVHSSFKFQVGEVTTHQKVEPIICTSLQKKVHQENFLFMAHESAYRDLRLTLSIRVHYRLNFTSGTEKN